MPSVEAHRWHTKFESLGKVQSSLHRYTLFPERSLNLNTVFKKVTHDVGWYPGNIRFHQLYPSNIPLLPWRPHMNLKVLQTVIWRRWITCVPADAYCDNGCHRRCIKPTATSRCLQIDGEEDTFARIMMQDITGVVCTGHWFPSQPLLTSSLATKDLWSIRRDQEVTRLTRKM